MISMTFVVWGHLDPVSALRSWASDPMCKICRKFPLKANLSQNFNRKIARVVLSKKKRSVNMLVGGNVLAQCFSDRTRMYNYNFELWKSLGYCWEWKKKNWCWKECRYIDNFQSMLYKVDQKMTMDKKPVVSLKRRGTLRKGLTLTRASSNLLGRALQFKFLCISQYVTLAW